MVNARCTRCGTPLVSKGGRKGEVKAKAKLFFTMQAEQIYVCLKCGYETKSQIILMK